MDYTNKIKALLAKANHAGTPRLEAEIFAAKAAKLMLQHGIDEAQLRAGAGQNPMEITKDDLELSGEYGSVVAEALAPIIYAMGGQCIYMGASGILTIVGTSSLLDHLGSLLACINLQMVTAANKRGDEHEAGMRAKHPRMKAETINNTVDGVMWDFMRGFGRGVAEKIKARRGELIEEVPGNGLVLLSEEERTKAGFNAMFPHTTSIKAYRTTDWMAQQAGRVAGRNADLGDSRVTGDAVHALN